MVTVEYFCSTWSVLENRPKPNNSDHVMNENITLLHIFMSIKTKDRTVTIIMHRLNAQIIHFDDAFYSPQVVNVMSW